MAGMAAAVAPGAESAGSGAGAGGRPLGLVIHSLWHRWRGRHSSVEFPPLRSAVEVLDYCIELGLGGLQTTVADWSDEEVLAIRKTVEAHGLYVEGSVELPRTRNEVERFEKEVKRAKAAGVTVFRSYLGGRRYEDLKSWTAFVEYRDRAWERMVLAEPVLRRLGLRLGVENHKDFRSEELAGLLTRLASPHVGWCFDFGNNLALLESAEMMLDALAPHLVTTHLKDMAVAPVAEGFELAEVPLGGGLLDLPELLARCVAANPQVTFNLEMITRDPLLVPCLESSYWEVMKETPGADLAAMLRLVRDKKAPQLARVDGRSSEAMCRWEADQNAACAKAAFSQLGFRRVPS